MAVAVLSFIMGIPIYRKKVLTLKRMGIGAIHSTDSSSVEIIDIVSKDIDNGKFLLVFFLKFATNW